MQKPVSQDADAPQPPKIWINRTSQIISFHAVDECGYEVLEFATDTEKLAFVMQETLNGFRVQ